MLKWILRVANYEVHESRGYEPLVRVEIFFRATASNSWGCCCLWTMKLWCFNKFSIFHISKVHTKTGRSCLVCMYILIYCRYYKPSIVKNIFQC